MVFTDVTVLWLGVAVAIVLTVVAMVHFTRPPAPGARRWARSSVTAAPNGPQVAWRA